MFEVPDLISRAQAGDESAFVALYEEHRSAIFTYLYFRVSDQAAAEELMAEVFCRMVKDIRKFRPRGKPILAWLYIIARNLVADHHRKRARLPVVPIDDGLVAEKASPEAQTETVLTSDCLQLALGKLTEEQRLVILLKFVDDRSNAEVATILSKTEGAVKSLQHRALRALKRAIAREGCYEP